MTDKTDTILVTGGTGTLGSLLTPRLRDAGCVVRALSRHGPKATKGAVEGVDYVTGDLATGEGIEAAVAGATTIVHLAGSNSGDDATTRTLVQAASRAVARHLVYISVVGADRVPVVSGIDRAMFGYFASKRAAERVVADSGLPWTTLRATQFYDLFLLVAEQMAKLPVAPLPAGMRFQPIETDEVAARLAELALGRPTGLVPDIAGPNIYSARDLFNAYLHASHQRRPSVSIWLPGQAARAIRDGANLAPDRAVGQRTWEAFLAERVGVASAPRVA